MLDIIVLVVVCCVYVLLATIVFTNNPSSVLNKVFATLLITIPIWCIVVFFEDYFITSAYIGILARLDYALASLMIGMFYWFCSLLTKYKPRINKFIASLTLLSVLLSIFGLTTSVSIENEVVILHPLFGGYIVFIALLICSTIIGLAMIFKQFFKRRGIEKLQIGFVGAGLLLTIVSLFATLVIAPRIFDMASANVTRIGIYSTLFFAAFSTYAVMKHRFLDIRRAVARSLTYVFILVTLTALYIGAVFSSITLLFDQRNVDIAQTAIFIVFAIILAFLHAPLKRFFDRVTDHIFYRHGYNRQTVLSEIGDIASNEIDLHKVVHLSLQSLKTALKSDFICIFIHPDLDKSQPRMFHVGKITPHIHELDSKMNTLKQEIVFTDVLMLDSDVRKELVNRQVQAVVRLQTSHRILGYVYFGPKQNGNRYDANDFELLNTVSDELALAIQNSLRFKEIQDFNKTLQEKVDDATTRLRSTNQKLSALDESKDDFISMASHQLRTPLTTVKGYLSMMLEGDIGTITDQQRRILEEAFSGTQRMVYLISDFLNVSRLQTGKFELELRPANLADILEQEIKQLQDSARARQMSLEYERPTRFPTIAVDENKIRQVIMNFIDNAVYYSQPGDSIRITLVVQDNEVVFKVIDHGIGVPAAERYRLFTKFFRASNAKKQRPDGTGIGLFMARKVVVAHNGHIIFETVEHKGSTFGFRLPLKNDHK